MTIAKFNAGVRAQSLEDAAGILDLYGYHELATEIRLKINGHHPKCDFLPGNGCWGCTACNCGDLFK